MRRVIFISLKNWNEVGYEVFQHHLLDPFTDSTQIKQVNGILLKSQISEQEGGLERMLTLSF